MRIAVQVAVLGLCTALAATEAQAQTDKSADQIISALKPQLQPQGRNGGQSRGIRMLPDDQPAAPSSAATSAAPARAKPATGPVAAVAGKAGTEEREGSGFTNLTVTFKSGSAELTPQAEHQLNELGKALASSALSSYRFRVEGHTDTVGTREANLALSERRAQAVVDYVTQKFGVARSRLEPVGLGKDHPLVPTPDQTPEARNRRVQIVNLGA